MSRTFKKVLFGAACVALSLTGCRTDRSGQESSSKAADDKVLAIYPDAKAQIDDIDAKIADYDEQLDNLRKIRKKSDNHKNMLKIIKKNRANLLLQRKSILDSVYVLQINTMTPATEHKKRKGR